jgi:hypothetical protein
VTHFVRCEGNLYYLNDLGEIWITGNIQDPPEGCETEEELPFLVEFTDFTDEDPNKKGVAKLQIRIELDFNATAQCWIRYDSADKWKPAGAEMRGCEKRSYVIPVVPMRSDHYRIKITGEGGCRIYSLTRESYSGSELKSRKGRN